MVGPFILSRVFRLALPLTLVIWLLGYLIQVRPGSALLRQFRDEKEHFISELMEHSIESQFDGSSLATLCTTVTWRRGLLLSCEPPVGGVGEVKNAYLNCIRVAIELGAELIFPRIVRRSEKDIAILDPPTAGPRRGVDADYFFDMKHLVQMLEGHCPQMKLHRSIDELHDVPSVLEPLRISLEKVQAGTDEDEVIRDPTRLREYVDKYVNTQLAGEARHDPLRLHLEESLYIWPTAYDGPVLARSFGRLLRLREGTTRLAAAILFKLHKVYGLTLHPHAGGLRKTTDCFVGVHLRTEKDVAGRFPDYETQATYYLDYAVASRCPVVYLATGAAESNITAFIQAVRDFNITVVLKEDLVGDRNDLDALAMLSWDQRALVDYEVMLRAGLVTGIADSSFAWALALRRRNAYGNALWDSEGVKESSTYGGIAWQDRYSTIFGDAKLGGFFQKTLWP